MLSFDDFLAYCRTLIGSELSTPVKNARFTVRESGGKVVFVPTSSGKPQESPRKSRTEAVLSQLASTNDYSPGAYKSDSHQASYILAVMLRYREETARKRLPAEQLRRVQVVHTWEAVRQLQNGRDFAPFLDSTGYDLLTADGDRLPPKAVFGVALALALHREILPVHFTGGEDSTCFDILREHGYLIVLKGDAVRIPDSVDEEFPEGMPRLRTHARRERSQAAARAKKAAVLAERGTLACERCSDDFSARYGLLALACIEIHHHTLAISDMPPGYRTKLSDLQCLCANCHRVVHQELREAAKEASGGGTKD